MYRRILIGFDGSEGGMKALQVALHLARLEKAECTALTIIELPRFAQVVSETQEELEGATAAVEKFQEAASAEARKEGVVLHLDTRPGHAAHDLLEYARHNHFDLLVIGHKGHSRLWGMLLGTTADRIVDHAPCTVIVVR